MTNGEVTMFWSMIAAICTAITTVVYTIATISISRANKKAAEATSLQARMMQAQTEELVKQYRESNRARIAVRFGWDSAVGKYLIIKNVGKNDADQVRVSVDDGFMKSICAAFPNNMIKKLTESVIHIAGGQEFPVLAEFASHLDRMTVTLARIHVSYYDGDDKYETTANIDFSQYGFLSTVTNTRTENGQRVVERLEVKG